VIHIPLESMTPNLNLFHLERHFIYSNNFFPICNLPIFMLPNEL
jgi:hypothetical protein